jgi:hypothetical protein
MIWANAVQLKNPSRFLLLLFGLYGSFGRLKTDLGMRAITKWLGH